VLPVLATSFTTVLALVPLLVLGPRSGLEILRPLAGVMAGGLLSTAVVVLLVLPPLFLRFTVASPGKAPRDDGPPAVAGVSSASV